MKRYDSYKDSGVEWIGEIPSGWGKSPIKYYYNYKKGSRGQELTKTYIQDNLGDYPVYSGQTENEGVLGRISDFEFDFPEGVIFTTTVGVKMMSTKVLRNKFSLSQNCLIMIPKKEVNSDFVNYFISVDWVFRKLQFPKILQPSLRMEDIDQYFFYYPPLSEQQQIVFFLDTKTSLIDSLIEKTQRKIELLKEKRTSLINEVVTKGLNPNVEMKDSGVEWIGEIPSHWETTKFKFKGEVIIGLSYKPENQVDENDGVLVMRSSNVQNGKPSFHDNVYVDCKISDKLRTREGDILICSRNGSRKLIGKNCLITKEIEGMSWGVFMTMYRTQYYKFFYWLLNSPVFKSQSGLFLTSTINQLTVSTLENMVVPYVSDKIEQQQIVEYLDKQTGIIDKTISIEEKRIELLKEYRQSLISEVVTGKRKVV